MVVGQRSPEPSLAGSRADERLRHHIPDELEVWRHVPLLAVIFWVLLSVKHPTGCAELGTIGADPMAMSSHFYNKKLTNNFFDSDKAQHAVGLDSGCRLQSVTRCTMAH